jgi:hypothetical protein
MTQPHLHHDEIPPSRPVSRAECYLRYRTLPGCRDVAAKFTEGALRAGEGASALGIAVVSSVKLRMKAMSIFNLNYEYKGIMKL